MSGIFISYRKQGADKASSLHLAEDLRKALGPDAVFRDEKGLGLGRFEDQLLHQVQSCKAMIAVIGPVWVERIAELQRPQDWVRRELEVGLERRVLMVPLLLEEVKQPAESDLPHALSKLLDYQSFRIQPRHWKDDVAELSDLLAQQLGLERQDIGGDVASIPNLSGDWIDTDGVPLRLVHRGDVLQLWMFGPGSQPVGQGKGSVTGNQIQFTMQRPDYGHGTGTGTVAPDGRRISGGIEYGFQRFGFSISKR